MTSPPNERVIIAETGDVLFTLRNPGAAFAVWERAVEEDSVTENMEDERVEQQDESSKDATFDAWTDDSNRPVPSEATRPAVVYQVSSQHLISASPKFKSELTSWSESLKGGDGFYHVSTMDWDSEAFGIMMNILHLRFRQVPKSLGLELLAKLAMLVDYYRCWEAFDLIADVWIAHLRQELSVPQTYGRDTMLWMLISWVFKLDSEFTCSTENAMRGSDEPRVRDMELGIPPAILQKLETRRSELIQEAIGVFQRWFDKFCGAYSCIEDKNQSFECGSMLLGTLTREMNNMGILFPKPAAPYAGFSLSGLQHRIKSIRTPGWHVRYDRGPFSPEHKQHSCSLDPVTQEANRVIYRARGLVLSEFVDRAEPKIDMAPSVSSLG